MTLEPQAPAVVRALLSDMLSPDGYSVVVRSWPADGNGHAKLEVVPDEDACADCLVPKRVLTQVLTSQLPDGVRVDEADVTYPGDAPVGADR
jgi:hypothetical protein